MKTTKFKFLITEDLSGIRIDKALSTHPNILSRSKATNLIDRGFVTKNNLAIKPSSKTIIGDEFIVTIVNTDPIDLAPYDFELDVVHEDEDVLVINKPSGLVVHPAIGHYADTLVNALVHRKISLAHGSQIDRPGIVHRIDKETTGLIVVAKNEIALHSLANQFKKKSVHRVYWALVYGQFKKNEGTITSYLRRHPVDRKKFASEHLTSHSQPQGKLAITHYQVQKYLNSGLSLVHCRLETGRTHQIRVHLSELQHPIVGDLVYCSSHRSKSIKSVQTRKLLSQNTHMFLHAAELGFFHPTQKKNIHFSVSWPKETHHLLTEIGINNV